MLTSFFDESRGISITLTKDASGRSICLPVTAGSYVLIVIY
jgi:hypothetical protein